MQEYIDFVREHLVLSIIWLVMLVMLLGTMVRDRNAKYQLIGTATLIGLMNREGGIVLDIRSQDEYRQGHITDAVHTLPKQIKDQNLPSSLDDRKNLPIIVFCKTGQTALQNANLLAEQGFESVYVLKDGLTAWNEANLPLIRGKK